MSAKFNEEKAYTYLKGYAMGAGWTDTVEALSDASCIWQKHHSS